MDNQKAQIIELLNFIKSKEFTDLPEEKQNEIKQKAQDVLEAYKKKDPFAGLDAVANSDKPTWIMNYL